MGFGSVFYDTVAANPVIAAIKDPEGLEQCLAEEDIHVVLILFGDICNITEITEGEILDAIHRPLGAKSLDGVKRRTRAGMGRCQAGFCSPRTLEILSRELNVPQSDVTKCGGASKLLVGTSKDRV